MKFVFKTCKYESRLNILKLYYSTSTHFNFTNKIATKEHILLDLDCLISLTWVNRLYNFALEGPVGFFKSLSVREEKCYSQDVLHTYFWQDITGVPKLQYAVAEYCFSCWHNAISFLLCRKNIHQWDGKDSIWNRHKWEHLCEQNSAFILIRIIQHFTRVLCSPNWQYIYTYKLTNCTNKLRNASTRVNNYIFITTLDKRWS